MGAELPAALEPAVEITITIGAVALTILAALFWHHGRDRDERNDDEHHDGE